MPRPRGAGGRQLMRIPLIDRHRRDRPETPSTPSTSATDATLLSLEPTPEYEEMDTAPPVWSESEASDDDDDDDESSEEGEPAADDAAERTPTNVGTAHIGSPEDQNLPPSPSPRIARKRVASGAVGPLQRRTTRGAVTPIRQAGGSGAFSPGFPVNQGRCHCVFYKVVVSKVIFMDEIESVVREECSAKGQARTTLSWSDSFLLRV